MKMLYLIKYSKLKAQLAEKEKSMIDIEKEIEKQKYNLELVKESTTETINNNEVQLNSKNVELMSLHEEMAQNKSIIKSHSSKIADIEQSLRISTNQMIE
jgi:chromosome segregation ATPase